MPTYYTCSFIATSAATASAIKADLEANTINKFGVPNRIVSKPTKAITDNFPKMGIYYLTKTELKNLRNKKEIKHVEIINNLDPETDDSIIFTADEEGNLLTGSYIYQAELSTQNSLFTSQIPANYTAVSYSAFHLSYLTSDPQSQFEGEGGGDTILKYYSSVGSVGADIPEQINYTLDGEGVDIVNFELCNHLHHEFFDEKGNTRIQYVNWYELTGQPERASEQPPLMYMNTTGSNTEHGTMTLSLAGGLVNSHAKKANLYIMPTSIGTFTGENSQIKFTMAESMDLLKRFHESKSIDPNTGYKRPTVVNISLALQQLPYYPILVYPNTTEADERRAPTHSIVTLPDFDRREGIRFQYLNRHYAFVFMSGSTGYPATNTIVTGSFQGGRSNLDEYQAMVYSGSLDNLVLAINNSALNMTSTGSGEGILSCSANGNTFTFYTDFPSRGGGTRQMDPVYIYTGSFENANNYFPSKIPGEVGYNTGSLIATLNTSSNFKSRINSIVINGTEQVTDGSNNNYFNSSHYYNFSRATGSFGQRGLDFFNPVDSRNARHKDGPPILKYSPTLDALMEECAEAGIIFVKGSANATWVLSQTGSSDNPFFDEDRYSSAIANNYFTYDVDWSNFIANEPIYIGRTQPSNGSSIVVANGPTRLSSNALHVSSSFFSSPKLGVGGAVGPGIDIYAPGESNLFAVAINSPNKVISTHPFLEDITFNTSSALEAFSSFSAAYNYLYTTHEFSSAYNNNSGGVSSAQPIVAGLIARYLQANPGSNVKDVRNWLKNSPSQIPTSSTYDSITSPLFQRSTFIDATGSLKDVALDVDGAFQFGPNANTKIAHLGFSTGSKVFEITGNFQFISGTFKI